MRRHQPGGIEIAPEALDSEMIEDRVTHPESLPRDRVHRERFEPPRRAARRVSDDAEPGAVRAPEDVLRRLVDELGPLLVVRDLCVDRVEHCPPVRACRDEPTHGNEPNGLSRIPV